MFGRDFAVGATVQVGTAGVGVFLSRLCAAVVCTLLCSLAPAQDPAGSTPPATPPAAVPAASAPGQTPTPAVAPANAAPVPPAAIAYGKVLVPGAKLRCWPSQVASPPVYEDVLEKDQVVGLGRVEAGFQQIVLPFGPLGYVSKKFTATDDDGKVRSKGLKVAFRYRPKTTEAPVQQLADGTELLVVGEQDDWWSVRATAAEAWLPAAEVAAVPAGDAAAAGAFEALRVSHLAAGQARLDAVAAQKRLEAQNKVDEGVVQGIREAFTAELQKPAEQQNFAPLEAALDKLDQTLAKESSAKGSIAALRERIVAQKWVAEAMQLRDSKPVPSAVPVTPQLPKDELERFQSIGWLRYETQLLGPGHYYLEKGGIRQHLVKCDSGRYELALFVGREVGIMGPRRRPATESLSVLEAERLEVLGAGPR